MSLLVPSATRDDRITRLEAQVAYLANRLGVSPEELDSHSQKPAPKAVGQLLAEGTGSRLSAPTVRRPAHR